MKRSTLTNRITPPKYKVGNFVLNETEAREMIARVAEGTLDPKGIIIIDEDGSKFKIKRDGRLVLSYYEKPLATGQPKGWGEAAQRTMRQLRANRLAQQ